MSDIKTQLQHLYLSKWSAFKSEVLKQDGDKDFEHPHLLSVSPEFEDQWNAADIRIMVFGISTNGWDTKTKIYNVADEQGINALMDMYEDFYFKGGNWRYGNAFWNYFYAFQELLQFNLKKDISLIWNNVYKISPEQVELEQSLFNVSVEEIKIFKPNIIMVLGTDASDVLHKRIDGNTVDWNEHKKTYLDPDTEKEKLLYYSVSGEEYPIFKDFLKKVFITYHPNARGEAGIKMKLMLDELCRELANFRR
ncbi:hypothetical protein CNR22_23290 [Sphingobacteriaceae bacterium]|nr:hypothetical protein CNR22_23290 [Sphingobacteriaceae bacterium]